MTSIVVTPWLSISRSQRRPWSSSSSSRGGARHAHGLEDAAARGQDLEVGGAALAQLDLARARVPREEQVRVRVDQAGRDRPALRVDAADRALVEAQSRPAATRPRGSRPTATIRPSYAATAGRDRSIVGAISRQQARRQPALRRVRRPPASVAISAAPWTRRPGRSVAVNRSPAGVARRGSEPQLEGHGRLEVAHGSQRPRPR